MYQLLFLIHGMGNGAQPTGAPAWFTDIVTGLRVAAKPFAHDKDLVLSSPKAGQVLVVPLTYHPLFDAIRAKWSEQSPSESGWLPLLKGLAFSDPQVLAKLPGWVATAGAIGCNLGSLVAYEIGHYGGRPLVERYGRWILLSRHELDWAERFFSSPTASAPAYCTTPSRPSVPIRHFRRGHISFRASSRARTCRPCWRRTFPHTLPSIGQSTLLHRRTAWWRRIVPSATSSTRSPP